MTLLSCVTGEDDLAMTLAARMTPDAGQIAAACARGLAAENTARAADQSVIGVDGLDEVELHQVLAAGLAAAGVSVVREAYFPGDPDDPDAAAKAADPSRPRCDLVLLPETGCRLVDPVEALREIARGSGTLFAGMAADMVTGEPPSSRGGRGGPAPEASLRPVDPADAIWIEVKAIGQFSLAGGVAGPNRAYGSELVNGPAEDAAKLATAPSIGGSFAVVVLFSEDQATARHDLGKLAHAMLDHDLPIGSPTIETCAITDRIGNAAASVCVVPVKRPLPM